MLFIEKSAKERGATAYIRRYACGKDEKDERDERDERDNNEVWYHPFTVVSAVSVVSVVFVVFSPDLASKLHDLISCQKGLGLAHRKSECLGIVQEVQPEALNFLGWVENDPLSQEIITLCPPHENPQPPP